MAKKIKKNDEKQEIFQKNKKKLAGMVKNQ